MEGHRPGYAVKRFLGAEMYYCRCSPEILYSHLDLYDVHYDLNHGKHILQRRNRFKREG